jgi:hypothetical protein
MALFTADDLMGALAECFVPALRNDVLAAGLVRSAVVEPDPDAPGAGIPGVPQRSVARIVLRLPGSEEAVNAQVQAAVENRLLGMEAISRVSLTLEPALFPILKGR